MKTIIIEDVNHNKYKYYKPDEEVDVFIEEGLRDNLWGDLDNLTFTVMEYDPEQEPYGIVVSDEPPSEPEDSVLWLHKTKGNLYKWKTVSNRWLSVDRAAFTPKEDLHSDASLDIGKGKK